MIVCPTVSEHRFYGCCRPCRVRVLLASSAPRLPNHRNKIKMDGRTYLRRIKASIYVFYQTNITKKFFTILTGYEFK